MQIVVRWRGRRKGGKPSLHAWSTALGLCTGGHPRGLDDGLTVLLEKQNVSNGRPVLCAPRLDPDL